MGQLTWKLVLPLTVISFVTFTKWWYVLPVDAPDTSMYGFPLAFMANGWHTSGSIQFFISEFIFDLTLYVLVWFLTIFCVNRYWFKIKVHKAMTGALFVITGLILAGTVLLVSMPDHVYKLKRNFDMEILATGYEFIWQSHKNAKFYDYHLNRKRNEKSLQNNLK
jgi:hypothetical protein